MPLKAVATMQANPCFYSVNKTRYHYPDEQRVLSVVVVSLWV